MTSSDSQGWIGRFFGTTTAFGSENKVRLDSGQTFFQQHLQAKVRFHSGTLRESLWITKRIENHQPCHVASRKDSEVRSFLWWTPVVEGSRWVTTSMVWHPNDPFKNKIHEIPSKKKTQKTSKTKDIIKHHLFQLCNYADSPHRLRSLPVCGSRLGRWGCAM